MKISIKWKIIPLVAISLLILTGIFLVMFVKNEKTISDKQNLEVIQSSQKTFYKLEENDIKMLKASMLDFQTNEKAKQLFKIGYDKYLNGENCSIANLELYNYTQNLYAEHKQLGITHFYFETIDSKIFLRVHQQSNCGDKLARKTYILSKETNSYGSGIEMGKTAFALRVVHPYYDGDKLIGYLEYGEEIAHFTKIMKEQTSNDYATIVSKKYIAPSDWETLTKNTGVRNNYNDLQNYVVIDSTDSKFVDASNKCWTEEKLSSVSKDGNVFGEFEQNGKNYICGGFALYDASNEKVGTVVVIKDVTLESTKFNNVKNQMIGTSLFVTAVIVLILSMLVNIIVINPIKKLTVAANKISEGETNTALPEIKSDDEIKDLSSTIDMLVGALKFIKENHEQKVETKSEDKKESSKKVK